MKKASGKLALHPPQQLENVSCLALNYSIALSRPPDAPEVMEGSSTVFFSSPDWETEVIWQTVQTLVRDLAADKEAIFDALRHVKANLHRLP